MTETLYYGELFAGVSGLGLAVEQTFGVKPAFFCENNKAASRVLAHHYPDVPNYGDVRELDEKTLAQYRLHVLAGGFPCQDVSVGGNRKGLAEGTRSGLWSEFARIIDITQPEWVVIENVKGLLSAQAHSDVEPCEGCMDDTGAKRPLRAHGAVLADLARLGYDTEWTSLPASDVGAPHQRVRVFILAHRRP